MDKSVQSRVEEIKNKIRTCTDEELENIFIEEGNPKVINIGDSKKIVYSVPIEYLHDLQLTINEEKEHRNIKFRKENIGVMGIVNNVPRLTSDELDKYVETDEQRKRRREIQRKTRRKRGLKTNIRNKPKKETKKNKYKGKKLKMIIATIGIGTAATIGIANGIAGMTANAREYDQVAATVQDLSEDQIVKKAEKILEKEISEATGERTEDISISDGWNDSSTYVTTVTAGENMYKYVKDYRGANEGTTSKSISNLISEIKNTNGSREKAITSLKDAKKFKEKYKITVKDGKLVEQERNKNYEGEER